VALGETSGDQPDGAGGEQLLAHGGGWGARQDGGRTDLAEELGQGVDRPPVGAAIALAGERMDQAELGEARLAREGAQQRREGGVEALQRRARHGEGRDEGVEEDVEGGLAGEVEALVEVFEVLVEGLGRDDGGFGDVRRRQGEGAMAVDRVEEPGDDPLALVGPGEAL
jgi:hypothetical protein